MGLRKLGNRKIISVWVLRDAETGGYYAGGASFRSLTFDVLEAKFFDTKAYVKEFRKVLTETRSGPKRNWKIIKGEVALEVLEEKQNAGK